MSFDCTCASGAGVPPTATESDIKKQHHKLVRCYHPDKNPRPAAASVFQVVQHAYEVRWRRCMQAAFAAPAPFALPASALK